MDRKDIGPGEGITRRQPGGEASTGEDDVEGHTWNLRRGGEGVAYPKASGDDDVEGHAVRRDAEPEGMRRKLADAEPEGLRRKLAGDDDDTEGHSSQRR